MVKTPEQLKGAIRNLSDEALRSVRLYSEAIQGRERHSVEGLKITAKGRALQKSVNRVNDRADTRTERNHER